MLLGVNFPGTIDAQEEIIHLARFAQINSITMSGWQIKEWKGHADIKVVNTDDAGQVLHLKSRGTSTALYKEIALNIAEIPYLNWQWKVTKLPDGGDVRIKSTDDQAAQIYIVFPKFPLHVNSRIIGYIWDTNAPQGSIATSQKFSKTKYIILRSGKSDMGRWLNEKRNVYEDYKMLFGEEPPKIGKVSVMIDSDDTKSSAEAFVGDIYLSRN
ncbi:MAG: DUF3047 domain-containing protein [Deltaproteobacteria bacterium]|nr:DUF3047 domain-containing protein [Deltaproteobacteria bacterium]